MKSRQTLIAELLSEYAQKRDRANAIADVRRAQAAQAVPLYGQIARRIADIFAQAGSRAQANPENAENIAQQAKEQVLKLQDTINGQLRSAGIKPDSLLTVYECPLCRDTGFVGDVIKRRCECFERQLTSRMFAQAGVNGHNFDQFDLSVFSADNVDGQMSQREAMQRYEAFARRYAESFPNIKPENLVFTGETGLGKTFLAACIAQRVLDRGFAVAQISAYRMLEAMRMQHRGMGDGAFAQLLECDLLLIDDLGTEPMMENVTIEYLFILLSERRGAQKPFIVATNLTLGEIKKRYTERIFSRLVDQNATTVLRFFGEDVRLNAAR